MTGWTGLWILLPLVGWFVWTIKTQGALAVAFWESNAGRARCPPRPIAARTCRANALPAISAKPGCADDVAVRAMC